jgi:hypothetical protein
MASKEEQGERLRLLAVIESIDPNAARVLDDVSIAVLRDVVRRVEARTAPTQKETVWRAPSAALRTPGSVDAVIAELNSRGRDRWRS